MRIDFVFSLIISPLSSFRFRISSSDNRINMNTGRIWYLIPTLGKWTPDEHSTFLKGIELYGDNWEKVRKLVSVLGLLVI